MCPPRFSSLTGAHGHSSSSSSVWSGCMFAEKCQALPARSAAEQFPFGALCEPASLLIYLLVKEITIAVITGRYVSKSGVGLSEWCRVGVAEPAPQEAAIKRLCLEWYRDSSPSVGLRPETRASRVWDWVWDWGAMEPVSLMTEGIDSRQGSQMADTSEQHRLHAVGCLCYWRDLSGRDTTTLK